MGLKHPCIIFVYFSNVKGARTPQALVVIEGSEYSGSEVWGLYHREKSNPSRICWLSSSEETDIQKGVMAIQNRYRRAKRKIPETLLSERYVLL